MAGLAPGSPPQEIVLFTTKGMSSTVGELFRPVPEHQWRALDRARDLSADDGLSSQNSEHALLTRYMPGTLESNLHSIVIQSPYIKKFLEGVFENSPSIHLTTEKVEFTAPFHEFVFSWDDFITRMGKEENNNVLEHVSLLHNALKGIIEPLRASGLDMIQNNVIDFAHHFALFVPNRSFYSNIDGHQRCFVTTDVGRYRGGKLIVPCKHVDTDGQSFGWKQTDMIVNQFEGLIPLEQWQCVPFGKLPDEVDFFEMWTRGDRFAELTDTKTAKYSGVARFIKPQNNAMLPGLPDKVSITDGRVIVDKKMFLAEHGTSGQRPLEHLHEGLKDAGACASTSKQAEHEAIYCPATVYGFCLTHKAWAEFDIDGFEHIQWNDEAFDALVLPPGVKDYILSTVKVKVAKMDPFDDIIPGKGNGHIVLLYGGSGVGKTLTAESVAEKLEKPLYSVSAGELGVTAAEVEVNLRTAMQRCTAWGAILLLDECDIFLEKRTHVSLENNRLVGVFLRLLEYYQGTMFMTTNCVTAFDPAFESRLHLTIYCPKLDYNARVAIWDQFLLPYTGVLADQSGFTAERVLALAELELNGRDIKNIVKNASHLARAEGYVLNIHHVETVLKLKGLCK